MIPLDLGAMYWLNAVSPKLERWFSLSTLSPGKSISPVVDSGLEVLGKAGEEALYENGFGRLSFSVLIAATSVIRSSE